MATVAERPPAWPARVERMAPGPQSATASVSTTFAAAAEPAEAAMPAASGGAVPRDSTLTDGDGPAFGRPATLVATMAGGLEVAWAAPVEAVGCGAAVGFGGAVGWAVGWAVGLAAA